MLQRGAADEGRARGLRRNGEREGEGDSEEPDKGREGGNDRTEDAMCGVFWVFRMFLCVCGQCNRTDVKGNQKTRVGERRETTLGG